MMTSDYNYLTDCFRKLQTICPLKALDKGEYPRETLVNCYYQKDEIVNKGVYYYLLGIIQEVCERHNLSNLSYVISPVWRLCFYWSDGEISSYYSLDADIILCTKNKKNETVSLVRCKVAIDETGYFFQADKIGKSSRAATKLVTIFENELPTALFPTFISDLLAGNPQ